MKGVPLVTTMSGAAAAVQGIRALREKALAVMSLQELHSSTKKGPEQESPLASSGRVRRAARCRTQRLYGLHVETSTRLSSGLDSETADSSLTVNA
jgi:hypothetical protein